MKQFNKCLTSEAGGVMVDNMTKARNESRRKGVTVFLSMDDYDRLAAICKSRGQSRADFLRAAMQVADKVPSLKTRPLVGACLEKHKTRLRRVQAAQRRLERKGE
jgi:hypothetical protein